MTGIGPLGGPSPGGDPWPVHAITGAFDPAAGRDLLISARHATQIGTSIAQIIARPCLSLQADYIDATTNSLLGSIMRLAACPTLSSHYLGDLAGFAGQLAQAKVELPTIVRIAILIERSLQSADRTSGRLDAGASLALGHATNCARELQQFAGARSNHSPSLSQAPLLTEALTVARRLADPEQRIRHQDPSVALLLQGMAGSLVAITAYLEDGRRHAPLIGPMRDIVNALTDATTGGRRFEKIPSAEIGSQLASMIDMIHPQIAGFFALRGDVGAAALSLETDAALLQSAMTAKLGRLNRPFGTLS